MQAMILAAGFGTRLLPYTKYRPKPLFPVLNAPLLLAAVRRLKNSGFSRIIVNCHHLGEQIAACLEGIDDVFIQHEELILGTGGGLRRALDTLNDEPLLVVNGDIYHSIDVRELYHFHLRNGHGITMAVHDYPRFNKLSLSDDHVLDFDGSTAGARKRAFTGIQVINPDLLTPIKKDTASCIIEYYRKILAQNQVIFAREYQRCTWTDMGTPEDYLRLHGDLLSGRVPIWPELDCGTTQHCIDGRAECADDLHIQEWACIGRARIGARVKLCRCVVWDGAVIEPGRVLSDEIVLPHY
jgi:NDP-sugar pyrophosphorylase family protein